MALDLVTLGGSPVTLFFWSGLFSKVGSGFAV